MVLVDLQWLKGHQFFADNGDPLASGTINIYDAGSTSLRTTYSNYLGTVANTLNGSNQIVLGSDGRLDESVYIPTGLWKYVIKDSGGTTIATEDNIEGALDTDALAVTDALPNTPVVSKTSDYTIVNGDQGKVFNADPTGGSFVLTLPSAATVGDGWRVTIRHIGTANTVTIAGVSSQTIDGATSRAITSRYESVCLVSDGANWHVDGYAPAIAARGSLPFFKVTDRLTAPPASPTAGARYILNGTGTGAWSSYSQHDVLESDGQGGWIRYTPEEGWFARVLDENLFTAHSGTAWVDQTGMPAAQSSNLNTALFADSESANTPGGSATTGAWTTRELDAEIQNDITGASLATNLITLPTGEYLIFAQAGFYQVGLGRIRFISSTDSSKVFYSTSFANAGTSGDSFSICCFGRVTVTAATEAFKLEYYVQSTSSTSDLGIVHNKTVNEYHASVFVIDTSSLQGATGAQGAQGPQGFAGFEFDFSSTTAMADPGAGIVRLDNATLSSVTAAAIDATSAATGNPDISDEVAAWGDTGGILKIAKIGSEENWATYNVTAATDNGGWLQLSLTYRDHAGSFSNTDGISVQFIPKGETGASGSALPVLDFQFNTATSSDPGSGKILFNNATLSSATTCSISDIDRILTDVSAIVATFDDGGASANRGTLYLVNVSTGAIVAAVKVTGSITDNTSYQTFSVTYIQGAAPSNNTRVAVLFVPAGATGSGLADVVDDTTPQLGGTLDTNAHQIRWSKGADVASPGGGALTLGTDGNYFDITGTNAITSITTLAVGTVVKLHFDAALTLTHHSTDLVLPGGASITTAAGDEAEFVEYATGDWRCTKYTRAAGPVDARGQGKETVWIPAAAMWARTTNGPAAAARELTTGGDIMVKGWSFDATTEEGVQFYIAFPKSWDKGTITFQAFWTNASGLSTETVSWGLSAGAFTDDDAIDTTDLGTEVRVSDTFLAQNDLHVTSESSAVTVGNTPIDGDLVIGQIVRSVSNDNMTGDADLLGIKIHFTTNAATDA